MKQFVLVSVFFTFGTAAVCAQSSPAGTAAKVHAAKKPEASATTSAPQGKIDSAKEADIRRLLDLIGTKALAMQSIDAMSQSIRPLLKSSLPPGDYREKLVDLFFAKFTSKLDGQHILDLAVPIYDKNFSHEEIRNLITFYQTPLGQKVTTVLPNVAAELQEEGKKWGESLGRDSMMEVLKEHPELADALESATKNSQSANK